MIDEKGNTWYAHNIGVPKGEEGQVYDSEQGGDYLVRIFRIMTDPTQTPDLEAMLDFHRPKVLECLYRDGWKLVREPVIAPTDKTEVKTEGLYDIIAVCSPIEKHGSLVGVQNDRPRNASEILIKEKEAKR